jgi:hypothetical protein
MEMDVCKISSSEIIYAIRGSGSFFSPLVARIELLRISCNQLHFVDEHTQAPNMLSYALVFTVLFFTVSEGLAQNYPDWFFEQGKIDCSSLAVGYADVSFYPDSSAARAIQNGYENFARQRLTKIGGGQAFWSTEGGTFWMGQDFEDEYDSTNIEGARLSLAPLDTFMTNSMMAVLVGASNCQPAQEFRIRHSISSRASPVWIESSPSGENHHYAIGIAPEYFYEKSSWLEAERLARRNLARAIRIDVMALQKMSKEGQEIRHEEVSETLRNIQTVARWRDFGKKIFYVLVRMPK